MICGSMREAQKQTSKKYAQFSVVGFSNMLVDVGALNLLLFLAPTGSPELLVLYNVAALVLANANSYLWNTMWTLGSRRATTPSRRACSPPRGLLNVAVGSALLWAARGLAAYTDLSPWVAGNAAKAVSTVTASTVSFLFLRLFVFRPKQA
jgi:putative flippase GtrA